MLRNLGPEVPLELRKEGREHGGRRRYGDDGAVDQVFEGEGAGLQPAPERRPANVDERPEERLAGGEPLHTAHQTIIDRDAQARQSNP